ncbi:MAG: diaminopimelate decarboxylase [Eubacteriales bacterium]|nr:diaminopimelate decarboxylase [Bacillota bacterium]MBV1726663.1 diaminopimelate decarboxylase [Desulforudis sp.]MDQ7789821.1 diaminopimelate decarboxylase [Clostridia bacterium]MDZ4042488.1 diaminopimelate decarboxylase [Eubacteriales bacterium]MBU4553962.1 diaminopimelate decarboxylase [Bacillota bacterium]
MRFTGTMKVNAAGNLEIGGCDTVKLAESFGTPLYVMDEEYLRSNCRSYYAAFNKHGADAIYAGKSLLTLAICRIVDEEGLSLDVVSGGELYTALQAGFPMDRVYFHGNNKSADEIRMALAAGVHRFVVDSFDEIDLLDTLAREAGATANVLLRLTPGIEAHTHDYIRTGQIDSKFGFVIPNGQAREAVNSVLARENLALRGLHCHIGSQIFDLEPFWDAAQILLGTARQARDEHGWVCEEIDLGGGLGIHYTEGDDPPSVTDLAGTVIRTVQDTATRFSLPTPKVLVEPGRSISGPAGTTLYTVGTVKTIPDVRIYVSVDGGMGDNPRPALYGSVYECCLANRPLEEADAKVSIAGRYCESGDMLIWDADLPLPRVGDVLAVSATGAYNYTMAMNYNRFPRPAMILVRDGEAELIVRRESYADLIRNDVIPARLRKPRD